MPRRSSSPIRPRWISACSKSLLIDVDAWQRGVRAGGPNVVDVAAEDCCLHRLGADHVERDELKPARSEDAVAGGDRLRELGDRASRGSRLRSMWSTAMKCDLPEPKLPSS
jgi:hypothetical protein